MPVASTIVQEATELLGKATTNYLAWDMEIKNIMLKLRKRASYLRGNDKGEEEIATITNMLDQFKEKLNDSINRLKNESRANSSNSGDAHPDVAPDVGTEHGAAAVMKQPAAFSKNEKDAQPRKRLCLETQAPTSPSIAAARSSGSSIAQSSAEGGVNKAVAIESTSSGGAQSAAAKQLPSHAGSVLNAGNNPKQTQIALAFPAKSRASLKKRPARKPRATVSKRPASRLKREPLDWQTRFKLLQDWLANHDQEWPNTRSKRIAERRLAKWVNNQRSRARLFKLDPAKREALESLDGWGYNALDDQWDLYLMQLKEWLTDGEFSEKHPCSWFPSRSPPEIITGEQRKSEIALATWTFKQRCFLSKHDPSATPIRIY